jgi:hypothetical protein
MHNLALLERFLSFVGANIASHDSQLPLKYRPFLLCGSFISRLDYFDVKNGAEYAISPEKHFLAIRFMAMCWCLTLVICLSH